MADDLPTEYEDIILGTGLQESILAAALARIGRRVLHFDRNNYYSGEWASFHLQGILDWIETYKQDQHDSSQAGDIAHPDLDEGLRLVAVPNYQSLVFNLKTACYVRDEPVAPPESVEPQPSREEPSPSSENIQSSTEETGPGLSAAASSHPEELNSVDVAGEGAAATTTNDEGITTDHKYDTPPSQPESLTESSTGQTLASASSNCPSNLDSEDANEFNVASRPSSTPELNVPKVSNVPGGSSDPSESGSSGPPGSSIATESCDPPEQSDHQSGSIQQGRADESGNDVEESAEDEIGGVDERPGENNAGGGDNVGESRDGDNEGQRSNEDDAAEAVTRKEWTWKEIKDNWRYFNVDLAPKLMFCRGSMVSILVQSRISRYAEFKAVSRLLTVIGDKLEHVPCSRSDVFSSRYVSMLEKRMLMKLIEFVLHYQDRTDDYEGYKDKPFSEFLEKRKLTPTLQHFVIHSIAMVTANTPTEEALEAMQFFLKSLGRYGNTAFLWTLYGSGELPQCFCRMSAVFGGIYMLRTTANFLIVDDENVCKGIVDSEGRKLTCSNVIMDHSYAPQSSGTTECNRFVSRAVLFTDKTLKESEGDEITFLTIPPPHPGEEPIRLLEIGSSACASPKGIFVVHLTRKCRHGDAEADLMPSVKMLFQDLDADLDYSDEKPKVLWSMFFSYQDKTDLTVEDLRRGQPGGLYVTGGPGASVGYQHAVKQAQEIFELICPGEEFLPPAPNPEDIIYENPSGDNPGHNNKAGFEDVPDESSTVTGEDPSKTPAVPPETSPVDSNELTQEQDLRSSATEEMDQTDTAKDQGTS